MTELRPSNSGDSDTARDLACGRSATARMAVTMETLHARGSDAPEWFLDTDYNELVFCVAQAFFPRTAAWDSLKRELRGVYADRVWEHLAGTANEPFAAGEHGQPAVKVIDDHGKELLEWQKFEEPEER